MEEIRHERKYRLIGEKLIRTLPEFQDIRDAHPRIAYLSSTEEKKKNKRIVHAECTKVNERYSWCCRYDFFITFYEPNIERFTDKQIEILVRHELHHIGVSFEGNEITCYIVPHDVEEFWEIIKEHGLDWDKPER